MSFDNLYIIGKIDQKFLVKINKNCEFIFLEKEIEIFENQFSLLKNFNDRQNFLRERWLSFQEEVFKKIQPFLDKDEDYKYVFSNLFFEASCFKTDIIYNFFKVYLIIDYIKKNKIKKVLLIGVDKIFVDFFSTNKVNLSILVKTNCIKKKYFSLKKLFKTLPIFSVLYYWLIEVCKKREKISLQKNYNTKWVLSYYLSNLVNNTSLQNYYGKVSKLLKNNFNILYLSNNKSLNFGKINKPSFKSNNNISFLDSYFYLKNFKKLILDFVKIRKKLLLIKLDKLFIFEEINYLSLIKNEWLISISSVLFNTLIYEKKFYNFFIKNPQIKELVYLSEFQPWEQMLNKLAHKFNVKTKAVTHTVVRSNMLQYIYPKIMHKYLYGPTYIGANSDLCKLIYLQNGFSKAQVFKIEAQRFNYLNKSSNQINKKIKKLQKSILIITSVNAIETQELLEVFASSKVKFEKIYIKEHPTLPVKSIINSSIKKFPNYELISGLLSDCLCFSEIIYTANGSSVLMESVLKKKITVSLITLTSLPIPAIDKAPNLFFVYNADSLSKTLNSLILNDQVIIKNLNYKNLLYFSNSLNLWKKFLKK